MFSKTNEGPWIKYGNQNPIHHKRIYTTAVEVRMTTHQRVIRGGRAPFGTHVSLNRLHIPEREGNFTKGKEVGIKLLTSNGHNGRINQLNERDSGPKYWLKYFQGALHPETHNTTRRKEASTGRNRLGRTINHYITRKIYVALHGNYRKRLYEYSTSGPVLCLGGQTRVTKYTLAKGDENSLRRMTHGSRIEKPGTSRRIIDAHHGAWNTVVSPKHVQ